MRSAVLSIVVLFFCLTLSACTMNNSPIGNPEMPYPPTEKLQVGDMYHLPTGTKVSLEQMLSTITDSRVVFVGETHDNPAAHRLQLQVLDGMNQRFPGQLSLGMEMFNISQQAVLDRWVKGELNEKEFLKQSDWYENWRMDFAYYRDLLVYARDHQIPVIGLNAPKELVKAVGSQPLSQIDPDLQAQLPDMDLDEPYQRAMTEAAFAGHGAGNSRIDGFHRVQTLWDEMMAQNIVKELTTKGPKQRMVVVAGGNHIRHGFGIPRRVFRRLPVSYSMIGVHEIEIPDDKQDRMMDVDTPRFPMVAYDYVNYVAYESLPEERVKLGVQFEQTDEGIQVEAVVPGSSAEKAGILAGDILLFLDSVPLEDSVDLVYEISQRRKGDKAELVVDRNGDRMTLSVEFSPLPPAGNHGEPKNN